jgi:hypothetical protein
VAERKGFELKILTFHVAPIEPALRSTLPYRNCEKHACFKVSLFHAAVLTLAEVRQSPVVHNADPTQ